jgi:hypothetical protein
MHCVDHNFDHNAGESTRTLPNGHEPETVAPCGLTQYCCHRRTVRRGFRLSPISTNANANNAELRDSEFRVRICLPPLFLLAQPHSPAVMSNLAPSPGNDIVVSLALRLLRLQ